MRHLVERYRDEAGFARIELELALEAAYAAAYAARVAPAGAEGALKFPSKSRTEQAL